MSSTIACPRRARRTVRRLGVVLGAGLLTSVGLTGVAVAHVEITPDSVPGGEDAEIAFRVPNESDTASTVAVKVLLPKNHPIPEVQTTDTPGWSVTTQTRKLSKPIVLEGEKVDTVVSQVTWKATAGGIRPDQFQNFTVSLEGLPDSGTLVFNAVQTYSDGDVVTWNEVSADPSVEPEHPAPTLTLTAAEDGSASDSATDSATDGASDTATETASGSAASGTDAAATTAADTTADDDSGTPWATLMAGAALAVSLLTALVVWRRGRPTTVDGGGDGDGEGRSLEDSKA
jgi:periplasmic copper chaperone A